MEQFVQFDASAQKLEYTHTNKHTYKLTHTHTCAHIQIYINQQVLRTKRSKIERLMDSRIG